MDIPQGRISLWPSPESMQAYSGKLVIPLELLIHLLETADDLDEVILGVTLYDNDQPAKPGSPWYSGYCSPSVAPKEKPKERQQLGDWSELPY
jgi:hypothetical protein